MREGGVGRGGGVGGRWRMGGRARPPTAAACGLPAAGAAARLGRSVQAGCACDGGTHACANAPQRGGGGRCCATLWRQIAPRSPFAPLPSRSYDFGDAIAAVSKMADLFVQKDSLQARLCLTGAWWWASVWRRGVPPAAAAAGQRGSGRSCMRARPRCRKPRSGSEASRAAACVRRRAARRAGRRRAEQPSTALAPPPPGGQVSTTAPSAPPALLPEQNLNRFNDYREMGATVGRCAALRCAVLCCSAVLRAPCCERLVGKQASAPPLCTRRRGPPLPPPTHPDTRRWRWPGAPH